MTGVKQHGNEWLRMKAEQLGGDHGRLVLAGRQGLSMEWRDITDFTVR